MKKISSQKRLLEVSFIIKGVFLEMNVFSLRCGEFS